MEKQKDRLIKLLLNVDYALDTNGRGARDSAECVADHLLANGVIVPPCKVGDTVYEITSNVPENIIKSKVVALVIATDGKIGVKTDYCFPITRKIGRMLFLTKEEAEQALRKDEGK